MTSLGRHLGTACNHTRRAAAAVAFASICLATGCTSTPFINDSSAAAAAADAAPSEATIVGEPPAPTTTAPPTLLALDELLAQERFVPLAIALERSGLDDVIAGLDGFVLLAPTGTAFGSTGTDIGIDSSVLMNNQRLLEAVMRYHIVADPSTDRSWRTLNGAALDVRGSDPGTIERVDGVEVLYRIPVRNGSVLVVPRLLLPASPQVG